MHRLPGVAEADQSGTYRPAARTCLGVRADLTRRPNAGNCTAERHSDRPSWRGSLLVQAAHQGAAPAVVARARSLSREECSPVSDATANCLVPSTDRGVPFCLATWPARASEGQGHRRLPLPAQRLLGLRPLRCPRWVDAHAWASARCTTWAGCCCSPAVLGSPDCHHGLVSATTLASASCANRAMAGWTRRWHPGSGRCDPLAQRGHLGMVLERAGHCRSSSLSSRRARRASAKAARPASVMV
jgi:hypothetical protein